MDILQERHDMFDTSESFWHAITILVTKPHVVNKRLWGCKLLRQHVCKNFKKVWEISSLPEKLHNPDCIDVYLDDLINSVESELVADDNNEVETEIIVMELLPKTYGEKHAFQTIFLQRKELTATFYDVTPTEYNQNVCPNFSYTFYLEDDKVRLEVAANVDKTSRTFNWLTTSVLPQVNKWSKEAMCETHHTVNKSLALVSHDMYYVRYNELKEKYGKELVKIWPECTDPSKFVYEDIAIATYLLLIWEEKQDERSSPKTSQSFVDMGCGNGLLVYLLTMEGHRGYGIDVRKRKIWDMYPANIKLLEITVTPSNMHTFTEVDWIIGNHSDELTPWIPVITAKSSYKCKFFLLPCCAYNFDGTKYQRQNSSKTQYTEYLEYIQKLCEDCGFQTYTDRLKIPSTKRICFVGKERNHNEEQYSQYCANIDNLIKSSTCTNSSRTNESTSTANFKAREPIEKVRNCTRVDRKVIDSIISCVAAYLLEGCEQNLNWSPGKIVDISEVVPLVPTDTLKLLKSECGGLQTLFKNKNHIFNVRNGKIQLQHPKSVDEISRATKNYKRFKSSVKVKVKECWFYKNHPQGCPLKATECSYLH